MAGRWKGVMLMLSLAFIGVGMAFAFVALIGSGGGGAFRVSDVWAYYNSLPVLSRGDAEKAIDIALQNGSVQHYISEGYDIAGVISENRREVYVNLCKNRSCICALVDLDASKVEQIIATDDVNSITMTTEEGEKSLTIYHSAELSDDEKERAKEIALSDPEVKHIIAHRKYDINVKSSTVIILDEHNRIKGAKCASVVIHTNNTCYFVHVDLKKGEVVRISPPFRTCY